MEFEHVQTTMLLGHVIVGGLVHVLRTTTLLRRNCETPARRKFVSYSTSGPTGPGTGWPKTSPLPAPIAVSLNDTMKPAPAIVPRSGTEGPRSTISICAVPGTDPSLKLVSA